MGRLLKRFMHIPLSSILIVVLFSCVVRSKPLEQTFKFDCKKNDAPATGISKYPYPKHCQYFVYCVKQIPFLLVCPPTTYYNPDTKECDFKENVKSCSHGEDAESQKWITQPKDPKGKSVNDCSMRLSGRYPLQYGDCTKYLDCTHGKAKRRTCNGNFLFDLETLTCQTPDKAVCWVPAYLEIVDEESQESKGPEEVDYVEDTGISDDDKSPNLKLKTTKLGAFIVAEIYYSDGVFYNIDKQSVGNPLATVGPKSDNDLHIYTEEDAAKFRESYGLGRFEPKKEVEWDGKEVGPYEEADGGIVVTSKVVKNDGEWLIEEACPKGKYVNGLSSLRRAKMAKGILDNVGIISLSLQCASPRDFEKREDPQEQEPPQLGYITWVAPDAPHTDSQFPKYYNCEDGAFAIGFQLNQDPDHGAFDDMATANMRLMCSFGEDAVKPYWKDEFKEVSRVQGIWTDEIYCKPGQAICGGTTQMMKFINNVNLAVHDNTGLNNVKIKCCDIPNPALACQPVEKEVKVAFCDNTGSPRARSCHFNGTIGTAYDYWRDEYPIYFYESVGFTRRFQMSTLSDRFMNDMGHKSLYRWQNASAIIWRADETVPRRINIPAGWTTELYQIIAECGYYVIHTNRFFRMDSDVANGRFTLQYFDLL